MIPVSLRLSGFLSYRNPVTLDFSNFELACISGSNGAGKSSLLDAFTWVLFGQARRRDDAIINNQSKMTEVTLDFEYEDNLYRVQRSKTRDKTTQLEFFIRTEEQGWKPMTEHSVRDTENRIQSILRMDYETFINASFFLQGKADLFAQQKPADRKRILGSILELEIWETYKNQAAESRRRCENEIEQINLSLLDIEHELAEEDARRQRLQTLEAEVKQAEAARRNQEIALESIRKVSAMLEEQKRTLALLSSQVDAARKKVNDLSQQLDHRKQEQLSFQHAIRSAAEIEQAYQQYLETRRELENMDTVAASFHQEDARRIAPLTAIEAERSRLVTELRLLQEKETQTNSLVEQLPPLQKNLAEVTSVIQNLTSELEIRQDLEARIANLQEERANLKAENEALQKEMDEVKERMAELEKATGVDCPLCGQPLSPEDRLKLIDDLQKTGTQMGDRWRENKRRLDSSAIQLSQWQTELKRLEQSQSLLMARQREADRLQQQIAAIQQKLDEWRQLGAPQLAETRRKFEMNDYALEERALLAEIEATLKQMGYDASHHNALRQAEQAGRIAEEQFRNLEKAQAALQPLEREIASLEQQLTQEREQADRLQSQYDQAQQKYQQNTDNLPDVSNAENVLYALQEKENTLRTQIGSARQLVENLAKQKKRQSSLKQQQENLNLQVARYKTLERAFGKDGIPALLIEQALPELEQDANDILDRLTNGNMSVRFVTQKEYKDKNREDKKETLDILISDAAGTREYELFSGGEAFRVNFAIRLALSRLLAKRSGARLQTLVIDEGFGSQDNEGRQRLVEAINLVRDDFAKVLVITHLEELKDAFPARIEVEKTPTGSSVQVVT